MEVRTLGTLGRLRKFGDVAAGSMQGPPSSQAVVGLLRKEPGSLGRVLASTALRALLLAPGAALAAYIGGARSWGRIGGATAAGAGLGSVGITLFLVGYYMLIGTDGAPRQVAGSPTSPVPGSQVQGPPQGLAPTVDPSTLWSGGTMDPRTLDQIQAGTVERDVSAATDAQQQATMPVTTQGFLGGRSYRGGGVSGTGW